MKIEASSFPNWNGAEQKRTITVTGDEMRVINPTPPSVEVPPTSSGGE